MAWHAMLDRNNGWEHEGQAILSSRKFQPYTHYIQLNNKKHDGTAYFWLA